MSKKNKKKKKPTKANHYIPQFYLKGFTGKDGKLWLWDKKEKQIRSVSPKSIAVKNDIYTTEIKGVAPDQLEKILANIERRFDEYLSKSKNSNIIPHGEDFEMLLFFFAHLIVRTPKAKELFHAQLEHIVITEAKMQAPFLAPELTFASEDVFERVKCDPQHIKLLTSGVNRFFPITRLRLIRHTFSNILGMRKCWALYNIEGYNKIFFCSDNPTCLRWSKNELGTQIFNMSFVSKDFIRFPLSSNTVLIGCPEGASIPKLSENLIDEINEKLLICADRFVFSADKEVLRDRQS